MSDGYTPFNDDVGGQRQAEEHQPHENGRNIPPSLQSSMHSSESSMLCPNCQADLKYENTEEEKVCPHCGSTLEKKQGTLKNWSQTTSGSSDDVWSVDRMIFAVVQAKAEITAIAKAKGIFRARNGKSTRERELQSFEMVSEFESSPAYTLTEKWGDLPDVASLDSDAGKRLFMRAGEQTTWEVDQSSGSTTNRPHIYNGVGDGTTSKETYQSLHEQIKAAPGEYKIVPAIGFVPANRTEGASESEIRTLHCRSCSGATPHSFESRDGVPEAVIDFYRNGSGIPSSKPEQLIEESVNVGEPIWTCRNCQSARSGPEPEIDAEADKSKSSTESQSWSTDNTPEHDESMYPERFQGPEGNHQHHMTLIEEQDGKEVPTTVTTDESGNKEE